MTLGQIPWCQAVLAGWFVEIIEEIYNLYITKFRKSSLTIPGDMNPGITRAEIVDG